MFREKKPETEKTLDEPEPMQIGSISGPLSEEERQRRWMIGLCLYCGKKGHYLQHCTAKPKKWDQLLN